MDTPTETNKPDLVISDLPTFVALLTSWHSKQVKILEHMLSIPAGSEVSADTGPTVVLEGAFLDGFQLGLTLALMELGELPFEAYPDPEVAKNAH